MKKHLPNLLTLINILLGIAATSLLIQTNFSEKVTISASLIILGGICDFFDGYLARKLNAVSNLGKQLDSFADLITFGIAPIFLLNYLTSQVYITIISGLFLIAGIYRLARHNITSLNDYFSGLPITAAGILLVVYAAIFSHAHTIITILFIILLASLMVSKVKIRKIH